MSGPWFPSDPIAHHHHHLLNSISRINSCQRNWDLLEWTRELAFNQCISGVIQCLWMSAVKQIKIIRGLNGADGRTPTRPMRRGPQKCGPAAFSSVGTAEGTKERTGWAGQRRMLRIIFKQKQYPLLPDAWEMRCMWGRNVAKVKKEMKVKDKFNYYYR